MQNVKGKVSRESFRDVVEEIKQKPKAQKISTTGPRPSPAGKPTTSRTGCPSSMGTSPWLLPTTTQPPAGQSEPWTPWAALGQTCLLQLALGPHGKGCSEEQSAGLRPKLVVAAGKQDKSIWDSLGILFPTRGQIQQCTGQAKTKV